jgi:hypothetical protein
MAAPRPKKKAPVKKKPPAKKKPSFLRKDTPRPARDVKPGDLRSQTLANDNTPRPAKDLNKGGLRAKFLQDAAKSAASRTIGTVLRTGLRVAGPIGALASMTVPAGEGSTVPGQAQKAVQKKMKREIRQGPKLAVTGVKEGIRGSTTYLSSKAGSGRPEYPSSNRGKKASAIMPKASMAGGGVNKPGGQSSGNTSRVGGPGGARALTDAKTDVKSRKSSPANTAATTAAASSSGGTSQAAKTKRRSPTRYQRDELAMEQKRSSNRPKKSIFSLFRKG